MAIEDAWQERFGSAGIRGLRQALDRLAAAPGGQPSPLWRGLEPYPGGWRASVRRPRTLPHFPMVLHRGGFPDGSSIARAGAVDSPGPERLTRPGRSG